MMMCRRSTDFTGTRKVHFYEQHQSLMYNVKRHLSIALPNAASIPPEKHPSDMMSEVFACKASG